MTMNLLSVPAAVGVRALRIFNVRALLADVPIAWTVQSVRQHHVIGSVVFGIGWLIVGTCSGPVAAQLGGGQIAAVFTIAGVLTESDVKMRRLPEGANLAGL